MKMIIEGIAWKFGDNIDTDQIIPAEYLVTPDPEELARHAFEKIRPEFSKSVKSGDILVAGTNFGCGSSREHAPRALMGAGISCVIARSYARIFFRNSINIGLPLVEADIDADENDAIKVDFENGLVTNLSKNKNWRFPPYNEFLQKLIDNGGLIPYAKERLSAERRG
ncbi:MAG: 3-isopropylmalate dehydratase small subunit [Thermoplasmata archaeon]|nr:3-isopropylmalate dehydratase small subunit [Thermoplasmata archaeon]